MNLPLKARKVADGSQAGGRPVISSAFKDLLMNGRAQIIGRALITGVLERGFY